MNNTDIKYNNLIKYININIIIVYSANLNIMETKEELIENIKEWIKIDNEVTKMKAEIKNKTEKKKQITENLLTVMKKNEIDCFDINGGSLVYKKNKVKKGLSGKTLLTALQSYYVNQPNTAEELTKHILNSREEQVKETIRRKILKI